MINKNALDYPWVIVSIQNRIFAVSSKDVQAMVAMPKVVKMPKAPFFIRGVINLRGEVMPVVDLRKRLNMISLVDETEEFCAMLDQREQDHRNWLAELEKSVKEHRKFMLATDPHKCAFGKWYDNFKTDNLLFSELLKKFDQPHKRIHAIANEIEEMKKSEDFDSCFKLIEETR